MDVKHHSIIFNIADMLIMLIPLNPKCAIEDANQVKSMSINQCEFVFLNWKEKINKCLSRFENLRFRRFVFSHALRFESLPPDKVSGWVAARQMSLRRVVLEFDACVQLQLRGIGVEYVGGGSLGGGGGEKKGFYIVVAAQGKLVCQCVGRYGGSSGVQSHADILTEWLKSTGWSSKSVATPRGTDVWISTVAMIEQMVLLDTNAWVFLASGVSTKH